MGKSVPKRVCSMPKWSMLFLACSGGTANRELEVSMYTLVPESSRRASSHSL